MFNLPYFEPLDLPPDISYEFCPNQNIFIFTKKEVSFVIQINPKNSQLECYHYVDTIISSERIFVDIEYSDFNVNELLWKISDCQYSTRFLKLEVIERVRQLSLDNQISDINDYLKKYYNDYETDTGDEADTS